MTREEKADIALMDRGGNENNMFLTLPLERRTEAVCRHAVELSVYNFRHVPETMRTKELCLRVVRDWGGALPLVPESLVTEKLCMEAVKNHGWALDYVPDVLRTPEICAAAVRDDAGALVYVPREHLTERLCIDAVKKYGLLLRAVPEKLRTREVCRAALDGASVPDFNSGEILRLIPYSDVCLEGLQRFAPLVSDIYHVFDAIPEEALDGRIALFGVKADPSCLLLLPEHLKTEEVCREAINREGALIHAVPEALQTEEMCRMAVLSNFEALKFIPDIRHTPELYGLALEKNALAIQYFKPSLSTPELCRKALEQAQDLKVLWFIPYSDLHVRVLNRCEGYTQTKYFLESMNPDYMTPKLAEMIFVKEPELFFNIPERFKDRELCETAVRYDGSYLRMVPEVQKTPELCREAIRQSPYAIPHLPENMKSPELYMELVGQNPLNLRGIPEEDRSYELCKAAFDNTYGKDNRDYSVLGALTEPSMVLQMFREQDDPRMIHLMMDIIHMNSKVVTEDVALEVARKSADSLCRIPPDVITPQVAEIAVKNYPQAIQWVPREIRTADMCLYAETVYPDLRIYVPDSVAKGDNIYSFHHRVDEQLRQPLNYDEYKKLYAGEIVRTANVWTSAGFIEHCNVRYDRQSQRFEMRIISPSQQQDRTRSRPQRKPSHKPKL